MMRQICHEHCPGGTAGAASAAVIAVVVAVFAVAEFAVRYALILAAGLVAVGVVTFGLYRVALRLTVACWRPESSPLAIGRAEAPPAVEARTAPLAIEAPKRVVISFTDVREGSVER